MEQIFGSGWRSVGPRSDQFEDIVETLTKLAHQCGGRVRVAGEDPDGAPVDVTIYDGRPKNRTRTHEWQWLCRKVGETAARATIAALPGNRRPYPLNVARALGVALPPEEKLPRLHKPADESVMNAALAQSRRALRGS